jgi:G:T-mismatch repair DNA endonuclease (very short patch repair protein)
MNVIYLRIYLAPEGRNIKKPWILIYGQNVLVFGNGCFVFGRLGFKVSCFRYFKKKNMNIIYLRIYLAPEGRNIKKPWILIYGQNVLVFGNGCFVFGRLGFKVSCFMFQVFQKKEHEYYLLKNIFSPGGAKYKKAMDFNLWTKCFGVW